MVESSSAHLALLPREPVPTTGANDFLRKGVGRVEQCGPPLNLSLHPRIGLAVQNGLVGVLQVELRQLTFVLYLVLHDRISDVALLPAQVSGVNLVFEQAGQ